ncbi:MAG: hypothetical protein QXP57_09280 [Nitrososphaerota archaeon]
MEQLYPSLVSNRAAPTTGKLIMEFVNRLPPTLVLQFFPGYKKLLDEIASKNWKYLYIETFGKYLLELEFQGEACKIIPHSPDWFLKGRFSINVELGKPLPELKVEGVDEFRINISTESFPRAVTIDLVKQVITYIESIFWDWNDEWINDQEKLSKASEVYTVVKWLIEEKKFKLHENLSEERCKELLQKFVRYDSESGVKKT